MFCHMFIFAIKLVLIDWLIDTHARGRLSSPGRVEVAGAGAGTTGRSVAMATVDAGGRWWGETQFLVERLYHVDARLQLVGHLAQLLHRSHVLDENTLLHGSHRRHCNWAVLDVGDSYAYVPSHLIRDSSGPHELQPRRIGSLCSGRTEQKCKQGQTRWYEMKWTILHSLRFAPAQNQRWDLLVRINGVFGARRQKQWECPAVSEQFLNGTSAQW